MQPSRTPAERARIVGSQEYVRQRWTPDAGDPLYLHLSDLRLALEQVRAGSPTIVLDFGCGGSPYRQMFPDSAYRRADFIGDGLDYVIGADNRIREASGVFDLILSTQVAEHVSDSSSYFGECYRLLKPGGVLVCTTHGSFEDHGCPYDFQRWTAEGLTRDLEKAGHAVIRVMKLTTGPRALLFLLERFSGELDASRRTAFGIVFWAFRRFLHFSPAYVHRQADRFFAGHRVVSESLEEHRFYIALLAVARKP